MGYGTKLKPKSDYAKVFNLLKKEILKADKTAEVHHVGGTSLKKPSGKGDVDIYIAYSNNNHFKKLQTVLTKIFGIPAKVTKDRARYNYVKSGLDVEIHLTTNESLAKALALRVYLDGNPKEASLYANGIKKMRKEFLDKMFEFKKQYSEKAHHKYNK